MPHSRKCTVRMQWIWVLLFPFFHVLYQTDTKFDCPILYILVIYQKCIQNSLLIEGEKKFMSVFSKDDGSLFGLIYSIAIKIQKKQALSKFTTMSRQLSTIPKGGGRYVMLLKQNLSLLSFITYLYHEFSLDLADVRILIVHFSGIKIDAIDAAFRTQNIVVGFLGSSGLVVFLSLDQVHSLSL